MPPHLNFRNQILTMNGARVSGLSDDDVPVDIPVIEVLTEVFGQDGTLYTRGNAKRGGPVTVKLLPISLHTKIWIRQFTEIMQDGAEIEYNGSWGNPEKGYTTLLRNGALKSAPPAISPGVNPEFMFVFEEIIPEFDDADFGAAPPPASAVPLPGGRN